MSSLFQLTVTSPVSPVKAKPAQVTVRMSEYKHDSCSFVMQNAPMTPSTPWVSGLPVIVRWAGVPSPGEFYGYVDTVEHPYQQQAEGRRMVQSLTAVRCMGATYPLKSEDIAVYAQSTVDSVLKDIANRFMLASIVQPHSTQWPVLSQNGKSWWTFAVDLAKRVGYTLYPQQTTLVAVDRSNALANTAVFPYNLVEKPRSFYDVLLFKSTASSGSGVKEKPGSTYVTHWTSAFSHANMVSSLSTATSDQTYVPQFQRIVNAAPRSIEEADATLAAAAGMNTFTQHASCQVKGNSAITVGSAIELRSAIDQLHAGTWFVLDVEHRIWGTRFITTMELGKSVVGTPFPYPPKADLLTHKREPGVAFRNNVWTAAWSTAS